MVTHMSTSSTNTERRQLAEELLNGADTGSLSGRLLRTREVALLFEVSERAVTDWATKGRIPSIRTPGGHRRYPAEEVARLLVSQGVPA